MGRKRRKGREDRTRKDKINKKRPSIRLEVLKKIRQGDQAGKEPAVHVYMDRMIDISL